jgi:hypothetical protein
MASPLPSFKFFFPAFIASCLFILLLALDYSGRTLLAVGNLVTERFYKADMFRLSLIK